jgi:ABC-type multidrug transport system fused ATPase/permease subunit
MSVVFGAIQAGNGGCFRPPAATSISLSVSDPDHFCHPPPPPPPSPPSPTSVFTFVPDVSQAQSAATNVLNLLDQVPEIDSLSDEGKQLGRDDVLGHIKFNNVHFRYPTRPGVRVLRNLSLEIKPGTVRPLACC